jgi:hypothetical protein
MEGEDAGGRSGPGEMDWRRSRVNETGGNARAREREREFEFFSLTSTLKNEILRRFSPLNLFSLLSLLLFPNPLLLPTTAPALDQRDKIY